MAILGPNLNILPAYIINNQGVIIKANEELLNFLGYKREQVLGESIQTFLVSKNGLEYLLYEDEGTVPLKYLDFAYITSQGKEIFTRNVVKTINPKNHVINFFAIPDLQEFKNIAMNSADLYYVVDITQSNSILVDISPLIGKFIKGAKPSDFIGKDMTNFFEDNTKRQDFLAKLIAMGECNNAEITLVHNGRRYITGVNAKLITKEGNPYRVYGSLRNIGEYVKEKQRQADLQTYEAINDLFLTLLHHLGNPLTGVKGYLDLIAITQDMPDKAKKFSQDAIGLFSRITKIINELQDFSKYTIKDAIKLNDSINNRMSLSTGITTLCRDYKYKKSTITRNLKATKDTFEGNIYGLEKILFNLLENSLSSLSAKENGEIEIYTKNIILTDDVAHIPKGNYICLGVKDNALGIPTNVLAIISNPYVNSSYILTNLKGLGIPMIYAIVSSWKGFINVSSSKNKGTEFQIYFPVIEDEKS